MWHPNTIHWGSSCSAYADKPRKSIGVAFRLSDVQLPASELEKQKKLYGRNPFKKEELETNGLSIDSRLKMCAQSVLMYSVWFPEFDGLNEDQFQV